MSPSRSKFYLIVNRLSGYPIYQGTNGENANRCWERVKDDKRNSFYEYPSAQVIAFHPRPQRMEPT